MTLAQHPERKYLRTDVSTPAGTLSTAPQSTSVNLGVVVLQAVTVQVPAGHAGLTGIQVLYDGTPIVPWNQSGLWIVGDGREPVFRIGFPVSHPVTVRTYNEDGTIAHSHHLEWEVVDQISYLPAEAPTPEALGLDVLNA